MGYPTDPMLAAEFDEVARTPRDADELAIDPPIRVTRSRMLSSSLCLLSSVHASSPPGWPGPRLDPLSAVRAKPALPVAGEALVRRVLGWLAASGVTDVVLNLHHRPETRLRGGR